MTDKPDTLEEITLTLNLSRAAREALMEIARQYIKAHKPAELGDIVQVAIDEYLEAHRGDLPAELPQVEELTEELTPEEEAELEERLADYMTEGKLDWEKVKAASTPFNLDDLIADEQQHNGDA